jgi:hypothetical protein
MLRLAAAAAAAELCALLRHSGLACVCLVAKLRPEFVDFELEVLRLAHAKLWDRVSSSVVVVEIAADSPKDFVGFGSALCSGVEVDCRDFEIWPRQSSEVLSEGAGVVAGFGYGG